MPPITVMVKPVSGACNMRCRYCFYADEMQRRSACIYPKMTNELLDVMVRRIIRSADSSVHFLFQGGEPTLIGLPFFEQLIRLERKYNTRGLKITNAVQTNGYRLTDEMIAFFAREQFLVGVSLDGTNETHDLLRPDAGGLPTSAAVRQSIDRLRAAGVSVNVLCVVNAEVARQPSAVFSALAPYEYLQFIPCLDGLDGEKRDYSLSSEAYLAFLKSTFDCYHQAYIQGHPVSVRNFDNWIAMLMGMPPENCAMVGRCGPSLVIESDGSVYPCDFFALDHWKLGNIAEDSLKRMLTCDREKAFLEESLPVPSVCQSCKWYSLCRNGCKRERNAETGLNRWCSVHSAFFEYAYPRMQEMAAQLKKR
ncbi:MAG: SPASM domain-containing protein [Clostridia bacterium]|nr:SPASM domain-containing protein [Clostridia bacterium]